MAKKPIKTIRIACSAADTVDIDQFEKMQGDFKVLSEEAYQRLRISILELGFSFPVHAWKEPKTKKIYVLDANQRITALKRMRSEEDYAIPHLPVAWIEAVSKTEAAKKLLAAASQYGEVTYSGLYEFIKEFKIDFDKISTSFQFPEIDLERFQKTYYPEEKEVSFKTREKPPEEKKEEYDGKTCPKCGFELS